MECSWVLAIGNAPIVLVLMFRVTVVVLDRDVIVEVASGKNPDKRDGTHVTGVATNRELIRLEHLIALGGDLSSNVSFNVSFVVVVDELGGTRSGSSSSQYPPLLCVLHSLPLGC